MGLRPLATLQETRYGGHQSSHQNAAETNYLTSNKSEMKAEEASTLEPDAQGQTLLGGTGGSGEAVVENASGSDDKVLGDTCITGKSETVPMVAGVAVVLAVTDGQGPPNNISDAIPPLGPNGRPLSEVEVVSDSAESPQPPRLLTETSSE